SLPCSRQEYTNALEEAARFEFQAAPVAILSNGQDRVTGLKLVRTELGTPDASGRRTFQLVPGSEFEIPADLVITALGLEPLPCPDKEGFSGLTLNAWGGIVADANQMTSLPGVFAGGDIVHGPSSVLEAVRDGRRAAAQIDVYLSACKRAVTV
ncbi:MAG TPA: FAD-dependent oxidoreductase, partial [Candidatus Sulfotelmatobacter sp.]|nr:FAD-dependent oxidoreductase [Candidatus Sulfotelmatobacter sp.]